ncbi:MAG: hypothetical protein KatS3mg111_1939 [Pirellulaceae bacterium]|nr:MAG: hypothetical protein KatS3mg111_1939 [Pirellulaceae bacterium]
MVAKVTDIMRRNLFSVTALFVLGAALCWTASMARGQTPMPIEQWIAQLSDPSPTYRVQAVIALGRMGRDATGATPHLIASLSDDHPDVRMQAILALVLVTDHPLETAAEIVRCVGDADEHVDYAAQWGIHRLFLQARQTTSWSLVQWQAWRTILAEACQHLSPQAPATHLAETLRHYLQSCRTEVARLELQQQQERERALAQQRRVAAWEALQQRLALFASGGVLDQLQVIDELSAAGLEQSRWDDGLTSEDLIEARIELLRSIKREPRYFFDTYVADRWQEDFHQAVWRLVQTARAGQNIDRIALDWLETLPVRTAEELQFIESLVLDRECDDETRHAALQALSHASVDPDHIVPVAMRVASISSEWIEPALWLLRNVGERPVPIADRTRELVEQWICQLLASPHLDSNQRRLAFSVGGCYCPQSRHSVETLLAHLDVNALHEQELGDYVAALAKYQHAALGDALILRAMESREPWLRGQAIDAVDRLGSATAVAYLMALLRTPDEPFENRVRAVQQLANLAPRALAQIATETRQQAAQHAAMNLLAISRVAQVCPELLPVCVDWLEDSKASHKVHGAVLMCLARLGPTAQDAAPLVEQLVSPRASGPPASHPEVRALALIALEELVGLTAEQLALSMQSEEPESAIAALRISALRGDHQALLRLVSLTTSEYEELAWTALQDIRGAVHRELLELAYRTDLEPTVRATALQLAATDPRVSVDVVLAFLDERPADREFLWAIEAAACNHPAAALRQIMRRVQATADSGRLASLERIATSIVTGLGAGGDGEESLVADGLQNLLIGTDAVDRWATMDAQEETILAAVENDATSDDKPANVGPPPPVPSVDSFVGDDHQLHVGDAMAADHHPPSTPLQDPPRESTPHQDETPLSSTALSSTTTNAIGSLARTVPSDSAFPLAAEPTTTNTLHEVRVFYATNRARRLEQDALARPEQSSSPVGWLIAASAFALGILWSRTRVLSLIGMLGSLTAFVYQVHQDGRPPTWEHVAGRQQQIEYTSSVDNVLHWGECQVTLPPNHRSGEVERPRIWRFELRETPQRHVMIHSIRELPSDEFFGTLEREIHEKGGGILVFVHGYNVAFDDAVMRAAQLTHDLNYPGAAFTFSWPSHGDWYKYKSDRKNIELSVPAIRRCLEELATRSGAKSIDVIAHSMGNVGLTQALVEMEQQPSTSVNNLILAAPDIDADIFAQRIAPRLQDKARRVTMYTSKVDLALRASRYFNTGPRAGETLQPPRLYSGIDVIDATGCDLSLLGHSYYGSSIGVLADLALVLQGTPLDQRPYVRMARLGEAAYHFLLTGSTTEEAALAFPPMPQLPGPHHEDHQ